MKKSFCIFLFVSITIITSGFKSEDSYIFIMDAYYPLHSDIGSGYLQLEVEMDKKDKFIEVFEDIFKNPPWGDLISVMPDDAHINSIFFDLENIALSIDFSKEFLDCTLGSSAEYERLISIVNTLGKFYNTDKVYISIENQPYESGHFALRAGEYFNVNFENAIKIN